MLFKRLKIGVIGTGHMGQNHVRNLSEEQRFDLVGLYDQDADAAARVGKKYGIRVCESLEELLRSVEAVVIAVPSSLHKEVGIKAAMCGVHALIEKPLALTSIDAKELAMAFAARGLKLVVGHIERCNPVFIELHKLIKPKDVFYIEAHRYSPFSSSGRISDTSVVEDLMIHDIDLVCSIMEGVGIKSIAGYGEVVSSRRPDFSTSIINFETNAHAVINASRISQDKIRTLEVHTADCCIYADLIAKTLSVGKSTNMIIDGNSDNSYKQDGVLQKIYVPIQEPLRTELIMFYEAVVNDKSIVADAAAGIKAIKICEEIKTQIQKTM